MVIFIIGLVLAIVVAGTYLTLGYRDFQRIRREVSRVAGVQATGGDIALGEEGTVDPGQETVGFAWRALGGVVVSVGLLFAISHLWWAWYVFPALALGTGIAVSIAFVIDPTRTG